MDFCEFADAINELGYFFAKAFDDFFLAGRRVLDDIMQYGRNDTAAIHMHFGKDSSDRNGMADVGFARHAILALVCFGTEQKSAENFLNHVGFKVVEVIAQLDHQVFDTMYGCLTGYDLEKIGVFRPCHAVIHPLCLVKRL